MTGAQPVIVTIPGRFPGLNEYTDANRSNPRHGARIKRDQTERVAEATAGARKIEGPYRLRVTWHERDRRRDVDNVEYAVKFILDGLVAAGVVGGDDQGHVRRIEHRVEVDPANPRVVVEVIPEGETRVNWTTQEVKYLEEHAHEGAGAIATALGRSRYAVEAQAKNYGISLKMRWSCPRCGATVRKPLSNSTGWCYVCTKKVNNEKLANEVEQLEELARRNRQEDRERQRLYTRRYRAKQKLSDD